MASIVEYDGFSKTLFSLEQLKILRTNESWAGFLKVGVRKGSIELICMLGVNKYFLLIKLLTKQ